jgi:hypothetical protein
MTSGEVTLTREQLFEFAWQDPMRTLATRYGLSDRGLAKICMRLHVPVPGRGYWAQKAANKEVFRPRLRPLAPTAPPEERQITLRSNGSWTVTRGPDSVASRQGTAEKGPDWLIEVLPELVNPHPLISVTAKALRRAKSDTRKVLVTEAKHGLDVRVSRKSLDRALRILDALLKALETRGFEVTCAEGDPPRTSVKVLEETITFYLEEGIRDEKRVRKRHVTRNMPQYAWNLLGTYESIVHDYTPTGELALRISDDDFYSLGTRRSWRDGKRQRLERLLNRFVVGLLATAEARKAERERREEIHRQYEQARREREEKERLRQEEERKIKFLNGELAALAKGLAIRGYVSALEARAQSMSDTEREELDRWLLWVKGYAERIDPALRKALPGNQETDSD